MNSTTLGRKTGDEVSELGFALRGDWVDFLEVVSKDVEDL
jgi:hypothetical protein